MSNNHNTSSFSFFIFPPSQKAFFCVVIGWLTLQIDMVGVGSGRSIGNVNAFDICLEGEYFAVHSQVMPERQIAHSCLLGMNFLKEYKAVIDIPNSKMTLTINDKEITAKLYEARVSYT